MRSNRSVKMLLVLELILVLSPVMWSVPYFTKETMLSELTTPTTQDQSHEQQILLRKTRLLCATNTSQADQVLSVDDPSDVPESSNSRPVLIKHLYKSGYSQPHMDRCPSQGAQIRVLILVTTAPWNIEIRDSIRQTWGRFAGRDGVAMAFMLGEPPATLKESVITEDQTFGDMVIGNSIDQYWSLPLKSISLLEWANNYCPKADFVFKCDDNVFVNVPVLLNFTSDPKILQAKKTIFGNIRQNLTTNRDSSHRHYIPRKEYPEVITPDFLGGPAYMLTRDAVKPMLDGVCDLSFVRIEDVFITGILARAVGVRIQHEAAFNSDKITTEHTATELCKRVATHEVDEEEMLEMWLQIHDDPDSWRHHHAPMPVVCGAPYGYSF